VDAKTDYYEDGTSFTRPYARIFYDGESEVISERKMYVIWNRNDYSSAINNYIFLGDDNFVVALFDDLKMTQQANGVFTFTGTIYFLAKWVTNYPTVTET